jgi:hypothetical protein
MEAWSALQDAMRDLARTFAAEQPAKWLLEDAGHLIAALGALLVVASLASLADGLISGYETWVHGWAQTALAALGGELIALSRPW